MTMKSVGSPGMFETKEDGTIIYYGKMGAPGFIVDKPTMKTIRGLYFKAFVALVCIVMPLISSGHRWAGIAIAVITCIIFHFFHKKIIKALPVSTYSQPGFKRRVVLVSSDASYWIVIPGLFICLPFLVSVGIYALNNPSVNPFLAWLVIAIALALWIVGMTALIVKIRIRLKKPSDNGVAE